MPLSMPAVPLSRALDIPFNQLRLSQANVRQINAGVSLDDLREDIAARGLLQSLNVRPILDAAGNPTGKYEVPAGGRRFRALEQLVKAKRLPKTAPIPCVLRGEGALTSVEDDSLAENTHRVALHPLDQFRAFLVLRGQNMSEEEIAARYFVSVSVVKQRLRLAALSPRLLQLYADGALTLEQLMAFSVTGDHKRQEDVWALVKEGPAWGREAYHIRRHLTEAAVEATDRRAVFVGVEAYEAAGGTVLRDLFDTDDGGWLQDPVLLDQLVEQKLQSVARELTAEGWKWIEVLPNLPFDYFYGLRPVDPIPADLSPDDTALHAALKLEYDEISAEYEGWDDLPDAVDQRVGEIEKAIDNILAANPACYAPEDIAISGAVVSLGRKGELQISRGWVRSDDEPRPDASDPEASKGRWPGEEEDEANPTITRSMLAGPAGEVAVSGDNEDGLRPLPEKLILELTAFRTLALREALAANPRVALTLLLHKLVSDTFQFRYAGSCLQVSVSPPQLSACAPEYLNDSAPAASLAKRRDLWAKIIPTDDQALWEWLDAQTDTLRLELLAFCVSFGVNAVRERPNPYGAGITQHGLDCRLKQADRLTEATHLDLVVAGWRPTAASYLNRVPRNRTIEAVREGCGERSAQMIEHLKKADMVVEAERLLADAGWLPELLRRSPDNCEDGRSPIDALPAFLTEEGGDPVTADPAPFAE